MSTLMSDEALMGQLIAELAKFGGFDKKQASKLARILLPHIKQQQQAYADVIIGEDIRMNFNVEDPNFEEKRRLEDALNKQKQVQRTRNENGGKV